MPKNIERKIPIHIGLLKSFSELHRTRRTCEGKGPRCRACSHKVREGRATPRARRDEPVCQSFELAVADRPIQNT